MVRVRQVEFFVILCRFLLFSPPNNPKKKDLKEWKKLWEMSSFYSCVPQMTILWCMVPEIWSAADRIVCHVGLFLSTYPPNNVENQDFEKMNKIPGDIIILYICTVNENHMMYGPWDMEHDKWNFFSHFGLFFALFPPKQPGKPEFWRNVKKAWRYYFTHVYYKWKWYSVWFLRYGVQQAEFFLILDHFLPVYPPPPFLKTQKIKILKNEKNAWRDCHFTEVYYKWQLNDVWLYETQQI